MENALKIFKVEDNYSGNEPLAVMLDIVKDDEDTYFLEVSFAGSIVEATTDDVVHIVELPLTNSITFDDVLLDSSCVLLKADLAMPSEIYDVVKEKFEDVVSTIYENRETVGLDDTESEVAIAYLQDLDIWLDDGDEWAEGLCPEYAIIIADSDMMQLIED